MTQNRKGGASIGTEVSIIATHQARIRCLLRQLFQLERKIHRFMNGAILRIEMNPNEKRGITCSLVHQGELGESKPDKTYYVTDIVGNEANFIPLKFGTILIENEYTQSLVSNLDKPYIFYLIRHGQGTHNVLKGFKKKFASVSGDNDAKLTELGIEQAMNTGRAMMSNSEFRSANYLFSSDLTRTIQTLFYVAIGSQLLIQNKQIIVLPCAHELNYIGNASGLSCDGSSKQMIQGNENKSSCATIGSPNCLKEFNGYTINWHYYSEFYSNGTRLKSGPNRRHCRNTLMLTEAIRIIQESQGQTVPLPENITTGVVQGGKRKTKKRRKHSKKRRRRNTRKVLKNTKTKRK